MAIFIITPQAPFAATTTPLASTSTVLAVVAIGLLLVAAIVLLAVRRRPRRRPTDAQQFVAFQRFAEPHLASVPRVHLVAQAPLVGEADSPATPITIGVIAAPADADAVARTMTSIEAQTVAPDATLTGLVPDLLSRHARGPLLLVDAGDELAPLAVERFGQACLLAPDVAVLTCDEDTLDEANRRTAPLLRQGPSADGQLARGACEGTVLVRPERLSVGVTDVANLSRRLLATLAAGTDAIGHGHVPLFLLHRSPQRPGAGTGWDAPWSPEDAERALGAFGVVGGRAERTEAGLVRVRHALPNRLPSVEIVVLFRDKPELTERCARSVLDRSTYGGDLRLQLVDNGSTDPNVAPMLERLCADDRVVGVRDDQPFNYAALNNAAVRRSNADIVLLLNNDTEVLTASWIEEMLEHAQRPDVGAVGALLTYPDGTVQHAGAALGLHGYAGHPFAGRRPDEPTPFGAAADAPRNWLAVTAACLMVRRSAWDAVDGFDEGFVVAGNDVDLCLRLTAAGMRSLCLPHVVLLHDESKSRGSYVDPGDFAASERSYGDFRTVGDPFFHPALALGDSSIVLRGEGT